MFGASTVDLANTTYDYKHTGVCMHMQTRTRIHNYTCMYAHDT